MLANYFAAAIRNLFRNRAYAAINLIGLAIGFAAALLIALYVRDEYSYERSFPDAHRIHQVTEIIRPPGSTPLRANVTAANIVPALKLDFPEIEDATRLVSVYATFRLRRNEHLTASSYWVEPNFLELFPMRTIAGETSGALSHPEDVVLTRKTAVRFFGRENVVGERLELDSKHPMRVSAVIQDWPANTQFASEVLLPAVASFSPLSIADSDPGNIVQSENTFGFVRLQRGASVDRIQAGLRAFADRHVSGEFNGVRNSKFYTFSLTPLTKAHFLPPSMADLKPPADLRVVRAMVGIALLILSIACGNFISMMTARATGRAIEVGVRKAVGATRRQVALQFLGECLLYVGLALILAVVLVSQALAPFNEFLQREIAFDFSTDAGLSVTLVAFAALIGVAAGAYPALVLSRFRPSIVLKGLTPLSSGGGRLRQALVVFQLTTLVALLIVTLTIHRQTKFAIEDRLRLPTDEIYFTGLFQPCSPAFIDAVGALPGVRAASCASDAAMATGRMGAIFTLPGRETLGARAAAIGFEFFEVFGIKPLAGRLLSSTRGEDSVLVDDPASAANPALVINESAARALGFSSPGAAVGHFARWNRLSLRGTEVKMFDMASSEIVGVVPDFSIGSLRDVIEPTVYYVDPAMYLLTLKFDGQAIPETLRRIKDLWPMQDSVHPFGGTFLNRHINALYADIVRQTTICAVFSGVAVLIAALGLLGLAIFTAERRTKEIGLRKVMGASRKDVLRFLGWQFGRPVIWANLLAWPCAYFVMRRWLEGFAYHVDQRIETFLLAGALATVITAVTVLGHALTIARARPVEALRYE